MPTDVSSSRDGENQRSDQTSTRRDASHNGGQVRDFATHQYQLYEQQQDAKHQRDGKIPAKLIKCARVAENRMPVEKLKLPDTSGLKGGMARDANDFLSQGQMEEYFFVTLNIHPDYRTEEQNAIVKLCEATERIIEKYPDHDKEFIQGKVNRAQVRIYTGLDTDSAPSDNDEAGPSSPREASSGDDEIPDSREAQIERLVRNLIRHPGSYLCRIRRHMADNKIDSDEYEYAKSYIRQRGLTEHERDRVRNNIYTSYR